MRSCVLFTHARIPTRAPIPNTWPCMRMCIVSGSVSQTLPQGYRNRQTRLRGSVRDLTCLETEILSVLTPIQNWSRRMPAGLIRLAKRMLAQTPAKTASVLRPTLAFGSGPPPAACLSPHARSLAVPFINRSLSHALSVHGKILLAGLRIPWVFVLSGILVLCIR